MAIDIACDTWAAVKKQCMATIEQQTEVLIHSGRPPATYDEARGEIAACRAILAMAEPLRVQPSGDRSKVTDRSGTV